MRAGIKLGIGIAIGFLIVGGLATLVMLLGSALIVPRVIKSESTNGAQAEKVAEAKADLSTLAGALQNFRLDCDRYPTTAEGLQALRTPPTNATGWKGPYMTKDVPVDPWRNQYHYEFPGPDGADSFLLESYGADGVPGGDGDNADIIEGG